MHTQDLWHAGFVTDHFKLISDGYAWPLLTYNMYIGYIAHKFNIVFRRKGIFSFVI